MIVSLLWSILIAVVADLIAHAVLRLYRTIKRQIKKRNRMR